MHRTRERKTDASRSGQLRLPLLHKRKRGRAVRMLNVHAQQRLGEIGSKRRGVPVVQGAAHEDKRVHASICVAQMPEPAAEDAAMLARFELAKEIITSVRNIRNQKSLPQKEALTLRVIADENYPAEFAPVVMKMANLTAIETVAEKDPAAAAFIVKTTQYFVPMRKIDAEAERKKTRGRSGLLTRDSSPR